MRLTKEEVINWLILSFLIYFFGLFRYEKSLVIFILNQAILFYCIPILILINKRVFISTINPMILVREKNKVVVVLKGFVRIMLFLICIFTPLLITNKLSGLQLLNVYMFSVGIYIVLLEICLILESFLGYKRGITLFVSVYVFLYATLFYMQGFVIEVSSITIYAVIGVVFIDMFLFLIMKYRINGEVEYEEDE